MSWVASQEEPSWVQTHKADGVLSVVVVSQLTKICICVYVCMYMCLSVITCFVQVWQFPILTIAAPKYEACRKPQSFSPVYFLLTSSGAYTYDRVHLVHVTANMAVPFTDALESFMKVIEIRILANKLVASVLSVPVINGWEICHEHYAWYKLFRAFREVWNVLLSFK